MLYPIELQPPEEPISKAESCGEVKFISHKFFEKLPLTRCVFERIISL